VNQLELSQKKLRISIEIILLFIFENEEIGSLEIFQKYWYVRNYE
jgi:hypothetical protein